MPEVGSSDDHGIYIFFGQHFPVILRSENSGTIFFIDPGKTAFVEVAGSNKFNTRNL